MTSVTLSRVPVWTRSFIPQVRHTSTLKTYFDQFGKEGVILKSSSTNIYENLAFEDWIHHHVDLQKLSILFLWRNSPAVVIGRHQNPWQECDLPAMRRMGIPLARRRSGGGTVFHDLGNVNMTFFASKKRYDRMRNLGVVTGALKALRPGLDVRATERFDILLNGCYKISGTAAKIGRTATYHHCTLLCSADRSVLSSVLKSACPGIKSNATQSVPSPVKNLLDEDATLDCSSIMEAVASRYNEEFGFEGPVVTLDPTSESLMPGIGQMAAELKNWNWVYGRTPKFSVSTSFVVDGVEIGLGVEVKNGLIEKCVMDVPCQWLPPEIVNDLCLTLTGIRFCPHEIAVVVTAFVRTASQAPDFAKKAQSLYENLVSIM